MSVAEGAGAGEAEFRVRVSLERYFGDERARVYMWVAARRPARWLAARLRRQFALPARLALLSRGHLLPPAEPLAALRADDPVEVVPVTARGARTDRGGSDGDSTDSGAEPDGVVPTGSACAGARADCAGSGVDYTGPGAACATPGQDCMDGRPGHEGTAPADALQDMKRRALALLEQYSPPAPRPAPRPARRRRVRGPRRRRGGGGGEGEGGEAAEAGQVKRRAGRLVRALEEPQPSPVI